MVQNEHGPSCTLRPHHHGAGDRRERPCCSCLEETEHLQAHHWTAIPHKSRDRGHWGLDKHDLHGRDHHVPWKVDLWRWSVSAQWFAGHFIRLCVYVDAECYQS